MKPNAPASCSRGRLALIRGFVLRGITHAILGAAVTVPIALSQSPPLALACLVVGSVGGGMPDWIDFRSGMRRPFVPRHRGASHGLPVLALTLGVIVLVWLLVWRQVPGWLDRDIQFEGDWPWVLLTAFAFGWLSHLASDACTISGIRPLLPFSRGRIWMLPRVARSRSDGYLDKLVRLASIAVLGIAVVVFVSR